jgi:hypothetical protein
MPIPRVAGGGEPQAVLDRVEDAVNHREVAVAVGAHLVKAVEPLGYLGRAHDDMSRWLGAGIGDQRAPGPALAKAVVGGHRDHGGGDAVAAHVEDVDADVTLVDPEDIERVARQLVAGTIPPGKTVARHVGLLARQQRLLHPRRRLQVAFHAGVGGGELVTRAFEGELGLHPRQDHQEVERLGDVVVGPELESADDVLALVLGGRHDDRKVGGCSRLADLPEDLHAVDPRHHDVEQDDVEGLPGNAFEGSLTILDGDDLVPASGEPAREHVAVHLVVVHDEQTTRGHVACRRVAFLGELRAHSPGPSSSSAAIFSSSRGSSTGLVSYSSHPASRAFSRSPAMA